MKITRLVLVLLLGVLLFSVFACNSGIIPPSEKHPYWEYFGRQPPYDKSKYGDKIYLINNESASDSTWEQLEAFLLSDKTDEKEYNSSSFLCGAFAEEVHNNAEQAGIKAAWVCVWFTNNASYTSHALNAFNTTDRGLVYVDCTGLNATGASVFRNCTMSITMTPESTEGQNITVEQDKIFSGHDKVAYIAIGKEYGLISLGVANNFSNHNFSYDDYDRYIDDWNTYNTTLESYNNSLEEYKVKSDYYNNLYSSCHGLDAPEECGHLWTLYSELNRLHEELTNQANELYMQYTKIGGCWGTGVVKYGIVSKVEIWW